MHTVRPVTVFAVALLIAVAGGRGVAQTVEDRITAILNQMTMDEKILQLHQEGGFNTADNTRLGVPGFLMADGPHGVRDGMATSFPVGIGMASTWDVELAHRIGVAMGEEFRGKGKHQALGPCLDIDRDPRNGRSPETGGEDPYLCARITAEVVKGIQTTPCIATVKHYNANHRENGRTSNNIIASQRVLHEHAGLAFRTAVQEGGAFCVMNAYNLINGEKCAENTNVLTTILRTHWGFPYYVVSDWGSIWTSEYAIKAGCDICMGSDNYKNDLPGLVSGGTVPVAVIDAAVRRVLRSKLMAGMVDYYPAGNPDDVNSPAHQQLCLEAGRKSLVLLKNQGNLLPLRKGTAGTIALVGPSAAVAQIDGSGSAYVTPFYTISPKQGIEDLIGAAQVQYAKGCEINSSDTSGFAAAAAIASTADAVVFCGGLDTGQEGEGFDRVGSSIELPGKQQDLINRLAAVNPNLVAVIFSGGVCGISRCADNVKGILYAFYPGQEGGRAVAEVLFGDYNPGGKMPVTMPKTDAQLPAWNDNLNDDFGCGYRWFDQMAFVPQFAFGSGLSYTTFSYSNIVVSPLSVAPGEPVTVSVDVTNTGGREGDEVAQLYLSHPPLGVPMGVKQLKGFKRITLAPGQTSTVTLTLTADELYYFNETAGSYDIEPGEYTVRMGGSSDNLPAIAGFTVLDAARKPDLRITNVRMVPPYPLPGQKVIFLAAVKNQGSSATLAGTPLNVAFSVNGQQVSFSDEFTGSIPPGGMALICGNRGPGGSNTWTADSVGSYAVTASVDPDNAVDECVEGNNTLMSQVTVYQQPPPNLALHKTVAVTSTEGTGFEGEKAVDGNMGTRWSSAFSDPQTIMVDLGAEYAVDDVVLYWEAAYGSEYYIWIWNGAAWTDVQHVVGGDGGMDRIAVGANARKVMMFGVKRGTPYGYSLYELEVHGSLATGIGVPGGSNTLPQRFLLADNYPNPFNPTTMVNFELPAASDVRLAVYDILGREEAVLVNERRTAGKYSVRFDATDLPSGVYFYRLTARHTDGGQAGNFVQTRKMVLMK
jgi:beta-glucosidase